MKHFISPIKSFSLFQEDCGLNSIYHFTVIEVYHQHLCLFNHHCFVEWLLLSNVEFVYCRGTQVVQRLYRCRVVSMAGEMIVVHPDTTIEVLIYSVLDY